MFPCMRDNPDYTSVVDDRQHGRLEGYLKDAVEKGAEIVEINPASEDFTTGTNKMPLRILLKTTPDMRVMNEEIFGPILPVVPYDTLDDAIKFVNSRPHPLALYYFDNNSNNQHKIATRTHSGGLSINDTMTYFVQEDLPFGGVGESGMGRYHGFEGFKTFSNMRSLFVRSGLNPIKLTYPPYGRKIHDLLHRWFIR